VEIVLTGMESHAMKPVAEAYSKHSLSDFAEALNSFQEEVEQDPIVHCHLSSSMTLLEQNLH
jgi:26S proteasome regulatory subunit N6